MSKKKKIQRRFGVANYDPSARLAVYYYYCQNLRVTLWLYSPIQKQFQAIAFNYINTLSPSYM